MTEVVDDGRRADRLGRVRMPRERRDELLAEYERSGLSQAEFARRTGVRYPTFAHWVQEHRREGGELSEASAARQSPHFVELRLPSRSTAAAAVSAAASLSELSVTMPDGVVLRGVEPTALAALVRALRKG